jgi:GTP pyrophosphokinase
MGKRHQHKIESAQWLQDVAQRRGQTHIAILKSAIDLYNDINHPQLAKGLSIANVLLTLDLDNETLAAALVYPGLQTEIFSLDVVQEKLSPSIGKLLEDVLQMQSLGKLQHLRNPQQQQIENLRKLLLAMITDVRSILIVLGERLWQLYQAKNDDVKTQHELAKETFSVYAPLANRIGVWQLKWEIEDLCLRYLQPEVYKNVAKWLASKRDEREKYIEHAIGILNKTLLDTGLKDFQVTGRVKHIYSIYCKMQRKNVDIEQIYDVSALRVIVDTVEQCYDVLGVLHHHWSLVPEEFDDYINHPKPNGYKSIHTVIVGPENRYIEVQIRTKQMHQESELGVAAHWRYKEGVLHTSSYEAKIALLRQILAWQKEVVNTDAAKLAQPDYDLLADQVYVFTPTGDIIDLPKGATPLDFAYTIHSEVGHRCRGAKVDGKMVPLTYELQTGERVEILTAKTAHPSRDWINPHSGYLKTPRARARVAHWFRVKDSAEHAAALMHTSEPTPTQTPIAHEEEIIEIPDLNPIYHHDVPDIQMLGVNNLLTHIANCCKPLPGDRIVGYITRNRGLSVHRKDCVNLHNIMQANASRAMDIQWNKRQRKQHYPADLFIRFLDRAGLLRDITTMLAGEKINILGVQTTKSKESNEIDLYLTIEISSRSELDHALNVLKQVPSVIEARRRV